MANNINNISSAIKKILENDDRLKAKGIIFNNIEFNYKLKNIFADAKLSLTVNNKKIICYLEIISNPDIGGNISKKIARISTNIGESDILIILSPLNSYSSKENKNIYFFPIMENTDADWQDRIREIRIDMKVYVPHFKNVKINPNKEFGRKLLEEKGLEQISFNISGLTDEIYFFNNKEEKITDLLSIFNSNQKQINKEDENKPFHITHVFDEATYLKTDAAGLFQIDSIEFDLQYSNMNNPIVIDSNKNIGFEYGFSLVKGLIENIDSIQGNK